MSARQVELLLEAAPVIEPALHKVPLDQMNVVLARNTLAVECSIFVGVFCQDWLLQKSIDTRSKRNVTISKSYGAIIPQLQVQSKIFIPSDY